MNASTAGRIAAEAHKGQKYGTRDYIDHVADVGRRVTMDPRAGLDHIVVAWLHDVLEDTDVTMDALLEDLTPAQAAALLAITKPAHAPYASYLTLVCADSIACLVKFHDIESNLAASPPAHLVAKYSTARGVVLQALKEHYRNG